MFVVFLAFLFFVLTPGILVVLPLKSYKLIVVAAIHAVIFAVIYHITHGWYMSEHFDNTWVQMPDKGWSNDGGKTAIYCPEPAKFSPGPPEECVAPQPTLPPGMSGSLPTCPAGKTFYGGMGKCADSVAPGPNNASDPLCSKGIFDRTLNMCLSLTSPTASAAPAEEECPPGCAPIHTNECEDNCSCN